jgi:hypothetical protein
MIVCDFRRALRGRIYNRCTTVLIAAALVVAMPSPAHAAQMDAADDPTLRGPLSTSDDLQACKKKKERGRRGRLIARFKVCSGYYLFDPDQEDNAEANYGAYWIQANIDATRRWCTRSVKIVLPLPETSHSKAPRPGISVKGRKRHTTKLRVDAQNNTSSPGRVKNSFIVRSRRLRSKIVSDGERFRLAWRGSTSRKLAYAAGIELSWDPGAGPPPVTPVVTAAFARRDGDC